MKAKIDLEKFICSYVKWNNIQDALKDQGLKCWNGEIVEIPQESEDEKIRKALIRFHKSTIDIDGIKGEEIIAWLEKQGEKSIDDLTPQEAMDIAVDKCFEQGEPKQEENDQKCAPFRIKKGEWYVCIHDFCNKGIKVGEIIQAEHDDTIRGIGFLYMENKYFLPAFENEKPQVDGFDAELNALLKKYEHLPKKELQEPLEFYLGVVRDDLDVVRENPNHHEGWVNIYKHDDVYTLSSEILNTAEEARKYWNKNIVATIKIYWEE